jgi:predicted metal-dependent enzyme (double-stranded beta helix superfamily)
MHLDTLVAECVSAVGDDDPRLAVRDVLDRFLADGQIPDAFDQPVAGPGVIYNAPDLTVLNVVWPPLISLFPHDHRMWAAIAIYRRREDNAFYRRQGSTVVASGGKELGEGDVLLLGDDTIHSVHNPARSYTGAIHVYGGDFVGAPRSQWIR